MALLGPYQGPGWRVARVFRHPSGFWRAEAWYANMIDLPVNAPQPGYSYYDDGDNREAACAAVLARAAKDKNWPLMLVSQ